MCSSRNRASSAAPCAVSDTGRGLETWPGGSRREEGRYEHGKRVGEWRFWHADGTFDPEFLSGQYVAGRRTSAARDSWQPDTRELVLAPVPRAPLTALIEEFDLGASPDPLGLGSLAGETRDAHLSELAERGPSILAELLTTWMRLDLADPDSLLVGATCNDLLAMAAFGARIDWRMSVDAPTQEWNRREILRLLHVWDRAHDYPQFWTMDVSASEAPFVVTRSWPRYEENARPSAVGFDFSRVSVNLLEPAQALGGALNWLVSHQSPDGGWRAADFTAVCQHESGQACDGPGSARHDVGVTSLALLALVRSGSSSTRGAYSDAVKRAAIWLLSQQDLESGAFCDWTAPPVGSSTESGEFIRPVPPNVPNKCSTCKGQGFLTPRIRVPRVWWRRTRKRYSLAASASPVEELARRIAQRGR